MRRSATDRAARPRRGRRADEVTAFKRQLLIDAARRVFDAVGLDGASMRSIARAAGCTTGAVYPAFRSKEQLYAAVLMQSLDALHAEVAGALAGARGARRRVGAGIRGFYAFYVGRPVDYALGLYLFRGVGARGLTPALDRALNARLADTLGLIAVQLRAAGLSAARARRETAAAFAFLIGLLMATYTHRLGLTGVAPGRALADYVAALRSRLPR
jgi:AcrR family transcriptional regulator